MYFKITSGKPSTASSDGSHFESVMNVVVNQELKNIYSVFWYESLTSPSGNAWGSEEQAVQKVKPSTL